MADARSGVEGGPVTALLVFRAGSIWYAVDASSVTKVLRWTDPLPVPGAAAFVKGVINSDGQILAVLDLAALLGSSASRSGAAPQDSQRCIVLQAEDYAAAAIVDEILGLSEVPRSVLEGGCGEGAVAQTFALHERMVSMLNVLRLISLALPIVRSR